MRLRLIYRFQTYINLIQLQKYGHHTQTVLLVQNHVNAYVVLTKTIQVYGLSFIRLFYVVGKNKTK